MKTIFRTSILACLAMSAMLGVSSCQKDHDIPQPKPKEQPEEKKDDDGGELTIGKTSYKVVAHRGGSSECGAPDNSRASLKYAMQLKCYASECDIYWTKDNNVIVAHADGNCKINGLHPWEATVEEIQKAGTLKNGEQVPTLDDFIDVVMVKGGCTKLWLDIKNITSPSTLTEYPIKAVQRSCEIIKARGAQQWCEFICTGNTTVARAAAACEQAYGIPVGWMSGSAPSNHKAYGFSWANLNAKSAMCAAAGGSGSLTVQQFVDAGMQISVFNVDRQAGDGNAVTTAQALEWYKTQYPKMKAICTNYPSWLINQVKNL